MVMNDPLASALSHLAHCEKRGKSFCVITQNSRLIREVLSLFHVQGYVGDVVDTGTVSCPALRVSLLGRINNCGVIKPRFSVTAARHYESFEKRYLPAKHFGFLIVSTSQGIFTQEEAQHKHLGGKLLAYCY